MKLLGRNKPPEQRLRQAVEAAGGAVEMRVSALLRPHGVRTPSPDAMAGLGKALEEAGLTVTPSLDGCGWDDVVSVAVTNGHVVEQPTNGAVVHDEPEAIEEQEIEEQETVDEPEATEQPEQPEAKEEPESSELSEEEAMEDAASLMKEPMDEKDEHERRVAL